MIGIYKITNNITGDCYIGQSCDVRKRRNNHHQKGIHSKMFEEDLAKYGWKNFSFDVIEECEQEDLIEREAYWIAELRPAYNHIVRGRTLESEIRAKISKKLTGRKQSEEVKEKQRRSILERHKTIPQTNSGHKKKVFVDGIEFESVGSAEKYIGASAGSISRKSLKKEFVCKGHIIRYAV